MAVRGSAHGWMRVWGRGEGGGVATCTRPCPQGSCPAGSHQPTAGALLQVFCCVRDRVGVSVYACMSRRLHVILCGQMGGRVGGCKEEWMCGWTGRWMG